MRFVFVSESLDRVRGGIERHAAGMAAELRRRGHEVDLVRHADLTRARVAGADWLVFDGVRRSTVVRHARRLDGGPRLAIFSHSSFLDEIHLDELRRTAGWTPSAHLRARRAFDRRFGRRVFGRFDRWFVLTESEGADVRAFLDVPADRIRVLGPFVSAEFLAAATGPAPAPPVAGPYLCAVSRIDRRKNFPALLEAIDGSEFRFLLAGQDRGGLPELERASRRWPAARWEYLGTVTEEAKVALLRGASAVVIPSVSEGVPAIALEALVLGKPVVLAGLAYGPDGPGVIRCGPDAASIRTALRSLAGRAAAAPIAPPTVADAVDRFLAALAG